MRFFPALLLLPALALAQSPEQAEALLHKAAGSYRSANTWYFVAQEKTITSAGDQRKETETLVLTARGEGDRLRVELDDKLAGGVTVHDGQNAWVYLPRQNTYAKLPPKSAAPQTPKAPGLDSDALVRRFPDRYQTAADRILTARILRSETLGLQNGEAVCDVVEADYNPPPGMREGSIQRTFWIARDSGLILRERSVAGMLQPGQANQRVEVLQQVDFQMAMVDGGFDEGVFVFVPPPGAQQVESLRPDADPATQPVDAEAPDFTLDDLSGKPVKLTSLRGKVVLLDFWASWCGPCRYDMPIVEQLHKEKAADGLVVYGVNSEAVERARGYLESNSLSMPTLFDPDMAVARLYRVRAIPTFVVVDRQGRIASYLQGTQSRAQLEQALAKAGL